MQNGVKISVITIARRHIFDFAKALSQKITLRQFMTAFPGAKRYGIHAKKMHTYRSINYYIALLLSMLPIVRKVRNRFEWQANSFQSIVQKDYQKADILVTNIGSADAILDSAKKDGTKIVLEYGSSRVENQEDILNEEFKRWGKPCKSMGRRNADYHKIVDQADLVSVPSKFVRDSFVRYGFEMKKFFLNPYGVNKEIFYDRGCRGVEKFIMINAGSQELRKGTIYTLQAWEKLDLENAELRLVGNILPDIKDLIPPYKKNKTIKFIGSKPQRTLAKYFSYTSCFISSSIEEGLAVTQLQAMACGLPLISNINSGGEDCVIEGHNGWMAKTRDVDDIAEKIQRMYDHRDECRAMGNNAAVYIQKEHSRDGYAQRAYEKYLTLL